MSYVNKNNVQTILQTRTFALASFLSFTIFDIRILVKKKKKKRTTEYIKYIQNRHVFTFIVKCVGNF